MLQSMVLLHMAERDSTETLIEAVAEVPDERVIQAFSLLGDETRMAIILALAEASAPLNKEVWNPTGRNALTFSELRARVGTSDPGNFNYHLGKLEGQFIQQTEDGYELLPSGNRIVKTVISIAGFEVAALPRTEIDLVCPNCGAPTVITHQRQRMYHLCTECDGNVVVGDQHPSGILSGVMLDPAVLRNRTPEEIVLAQYGWKFYSFALALEGICIMCSGSITGSLHVCDEHNAEIDGPCPACGYIYEATGQFVCTVCAHTMLWGIVPLGVIHPAGIAFCWQRGLELGFGDNDLEILERLFELFGNSEVEIRSVEPPVGRVTLRDEGDELAITFDSSLNVVDVNR